MPMLRHSCKPVAAAPTCSLNCIQMARSDSDRTAPMLSQLSSLRIDPLSPLKIDLQGPSAHPD